MLPGLGSTHLLPKIVGRQRRRWSWFSPHGCIDAREAAEIGLVNKVVPAESSCWRRRAATPECAVAECDPSAAGRRETQAIHYGATVTLEPRPCRTSARTVERAACKRRTSSPDGLTAVQFPVTSNQPDENRKRWRESRAYGAYVPFDAPAAGADQRADLPPKPDGPEKAVAYYDEDSRHDGGRGGGGRVSTEVDPLERRRRASSPRRPIPFRGEAGSGADRQGSRPAARHQRPPTSRGLAARGYVAAIETAANAVAAGSARNVLVIASDCRMGAPRGALEAKLGDGAARLPGERGQGDREASRARARGRQRAAGSCGAAEGESLHSQLGGSLRRSRRATRPT